MEADLNAQVTDAFSLRDPYEAYLSAPDPGRGLPYVQYGREGLEERWCDFFRAFLEKLRGNAIMPGRFAFGQGVDCIEDFFQHEALGQLDFSGMHPDAGPLEAFFCPHETCVATHDPVSNNLKPGEPSLVVGREREVANPGLQHFRFALLFAQK
ncbi:unnamed protein product [Sphagnum compactum]